MQIVKKIFILKARKKNNKNSFNNYNRNISPKFGNFMQKNSSFNNNSRSPNRMTKSLIIRQKEMKKKMKKIENYQKKKEENYEFVKKNQEISKENLEKFYVISLIIFQGQKRYNHVTGVIKDDLQAWRTHIKEGFINFPEKSSNDKSLDDKNKKLNYAPPSKRLLKPTKTLEGIFKENKKILAKIAYKQDLKKWEKEIKENWSKIGNEEVNNIMVNAVNLIFREM